MCNKHVENMSEVTPFYSVIKSHTNRICNSLYFNMISVTHDLHNRPIKAGATVEMPIDSMKAPDMLHPVQVRKPSPLEPPMSVMLKH